MDGVAINRSVNKTYGINEIYNFYKKEYKESLSTYKDMQQSYRDVILNIESEIYSINNKLSIYEKDLLYDDNITLIKERLGDKYSATNGYVLLLRGYYTRLNKAKLEHNLYRDKVIKLSGSFLNAIEFKYIYKQYNFHMSNAVLCGYRHFYLGGVLGRVVIDKFNNKGRKRGIDWGTSNKIKAKLLEDGKTLYKEVKNEDGTVSDNGGEKWLITYNHKDVDAFWKWKSMLSSLVKTHRFKPTNYRPTIIYGEDGNQLTTSELEEKSTIRDIKSYRLGNTQKCTIITNLDESYFDRYNDDYVLTNYKIDYKTDL